ncbi:MAG: MBL fold metallo-hydrolase, partial [Kiritimatiellae bacterium]|nr:MBL fold metallo-hydrolase [Kiritimatiellia bacterium]
MKILPVRFAENGFMTQPFALGGEGAEGLDPAVKYRSCLQNWVIDTGNEVILVDTGLPAEYPDTAPTPDAAIYVGTKIKSYVEALADLGYKPEQVSKILITHKHPDHTGELRAFPNAQIFCSAAEAETDDVKPFHPTVATFPDGPYHEFPASQKIAPGVTYLPARGHTTGNCIVAVESDGLVYLIHGDVTYTDVALYENKLSVVFEDLAAARETLDRCRAFCRARPTVWLGTHTPEALESLAGK